MLNIEVNRASSKNTSDKIILTETIFDYSKLINVHGIEYKIESYYIAIGKARMTQGWILHLSVVLSQIEMLLREIIPFLINEKIAFKIPLNRDASIDILSGYLGIAQVGKIVTIYPENDLHALNLAKIMIDITKSYKGPNIPTDIFLGNIVYTRYGSINPVILTDAHGKNDKYIYNSKKQLIKDPYSIPFSLPDGISWPYEEIANPYVKPNKLILKNIFKPISLLKPDVRGNVFKGLYLKSLLKVKKCVIKQGYRNMSSENSGRDIHDRLSWQYQLHLELCNTIPLPEVYDFFIEDGDTYFVMEYIKGRSLYEKAREMNPNSKSWFQLSVSDRILLVSYAIEISIILLKLHDKGYVHRDVVPVNFLISTKGNIRLIDIELAYSINKRVPEPPFEFGTAGFMSPEQQLVQIPTIKEDVYGFGALLSELFCGISPIKFQITNQDRLFKTLFLFIGDQEMAKIVANCMNINPQERPALTSINQKLKLYKSRLGNKLADTEHIKVTGEIDFEKVKKIVSQAIKGLNKPPIVISENVWYSKKINGENSTIFKSKQYTRYLGMREGLAGILYLLARVKKLGFQVEPCLTEYYSSWKYLENTVFPISTIHPIGFYEGYTGISVAIFEGIESGLLQNNELNKQNITKILDIDINELNLANGIAGQGIAILQCRSLLESNFFEKRMTTIIDKVLKSQNKDGSWLLTTNFEIKKYSFDLSFGYGIPGIIWMLLEYNLICPNSEVQKAAENAMQWLLKKTRGLNNTDFSPKKGSNNCLEIGDERKGVILTIIKAYDSLKKESYKEIAENALKSYPSRMINNNFTQNNGLPALGELYLEAWKTFNNIEWLNRANWVANIFINTIIANDSDAGYWMMEENNYPTADFMIGNSGIIHFLARCTDPSKLNYRLLK